METNAITLKNPVSYTGAVNKENKEEKQAKTKIDGKKLLILAAAATATAAIAGIAIYNHKKSLTNLNIDKFKKIGSFEKGKATIKNKPFSGEITVPNKNGKIIMEYKDGNLVQSTKYSPLRKPLSSEMVDVPIMTKTYETKDGIKTIKQFLYSHADGFDNIKSEMTKTPYKTTTIKSDEIIAESSGFHSFPHDTFKTIAKKQQDGTWTATKEIAETPKNRYYSKYWRKKTINTKTGEVINNEVKLFDKPKKSNPMIKITTKDGITTINGKPFAKRTVSFDNKGNKIIKIDYSNINCGYKEIIITPDGKKTVVDKSGGIEYMKDKIY